VELKQVFDTSGFDGGAGELIEQHPELTPAARQLLMDVVSRYPRTPFAAQAKYYVAVIDDYCLKDTKSALRAYDSFLRQYPNAKPYTEKARQRLTVLRVGSK
jgi:outer membrane protein assembly factor BamD (BamD/ComL family)